MIQSVISTRVTHPDSTAAVHNPKMVGNPWRIPRLLRGSGTAAKHSSRPPPSPPARASSAARSARIASAAATCGSSSVGGPPAGQGMTD
ncbi:MAG: hypothetical protein ACRDSN_10665 [Pseudonocardiaceae bacterium]